MTPRPDPLDLRDAALLHAAIDAPEAAVAAWVGVDTDAFLEGELSAGALPLLPLIWHNLAEAGYDGPTMARLKGLARRTWFVNQAAMQAVEDAIVALESGGLDTTVLGGAAAALAPWGWSGDLKYRTLADSAVMVSPADRVRAVEVLRKPGWAAPAADRLERHRRLWQEVDLASREDPPLRLVSSPSRWLSPPGPGSQWWRVSPATGSIRTLDRSNALLVTCLDGVLSSQRRLVWVADAHRIIDAGDAIDLGRILRTAAEHGVAAVTVAALSRVRDEFGAPLPTDLDAMAPKLPNDPAIRRREHRSRTIARLHARSGAVSSVRADWGAARWNLPGRSSFTAFPEFLADRWNLDTTAQVPGAALRRLIGHLSSRR